MKSGFNDSGLYPVEKSKPMKNIMSMQLKCDEVDKSNGKEDSVVKNLRRVIESVLTPSPSEPILAALTNAKKRRACVLAKKRRNFNSTRCCGQVTRKREEKR